MTRDNRAPHAWWLLPAALLGFLLWVLLIWRAADVVVWIMEAMGWTF